jgi:hypothetical protein
MKSPKMAASAYAGLEANCRWVPPGSAIADLVRNAEFRIDHLETGYMRGPKPMTFMYEGIAPPVIL